MTRTALDRPPASRPVDAIASERVVVTTLDDAWIDRASVVLARSFADEPWSEWALGGTLESRRRVLALSLRASLRGRRHDIELHGAQLHGRLVGVGVRFPPGCWPPSRWDALRGLPWRALGVLVRARSSRRTLRRLVANPTMERPHGSYPPHWYLWLMGVDPAYRRRGVASALARHVTGKADADGVGCYLETFGDETESLYRAFGFEVHERFEIAPGAPPGRTMWRDPRPLETDSAAIRGQPPGG